MSIKSTLKRSPLYPPLSRLNRLRRTAAAWPQTLQNRRAPKSIVLLYHRVTNLETDVEQLAVTPERFEAHLQFLKHQYRLLSLPEFVSHLRAGRYVPNSVLVTFDDGYRDNVTTAYPLLKKYSIPAAIFVAGSGPQTREWWWDELPHLLYQPDDRPGTLRLTLDHEVTFTLKTDDDLAAAHETISRFLKPAALPERERVLNALLEWRGWPRVIRPAYRQCLPEELQAMAASGLVSIGGHTATHQQLSLLPLDSQADEMAKNVAYITDTIGEEPLAFAYPFGSKQDYNEASVLLTKKYFKAAFTTTRGQVTTRTDPCRIPRFVVKNWTIDEFREKIKTFFIKP